MGGHLLATDVAYLLGYMQKLLIILIPVICLTVLVLHGDLNALYLLTFLAGLGLPSPADGLRKPAPAGRPEAIPLLESEIKILSSLAEEPAAALAGPPPAVPIEQSTTLPYSNRDLVSELKSGETAAVAQAATMAPSPPTRALNTTRIHRDLQKLQQGVGAILLWLLTSLGAGCGTLPTLDRYGAALAACGVKEAPAALQDGVSLALHGGEGWRGALDALLTRYSSCVVEAEVARYAPERGRRAVALTVEGRAPSPSELAEQRAQAWLVERRR